MLWVCVPGLPAERLISRASVSILAVPWVARRSSLLWVRSAAPTYIESGMPFTYINLYKSIV